MPDIIPHVHSSDVDYFEVPERKGLTQDVSKIIHKVVIHLDKILGWGLENPEEYPLAKIIVTGSKEKTCDTALADYCQNVSKYSNELYFEKICTAVISYRECLNKYGWEKFINDIQKYSKSEPRDDDGPIIETYLNYDPEYQRIMKDEYSVVNDPNRLPEIANEFVLLFIKEYDLGLDNNEVISIIMNMFDWLYTNGYTKTQVLLAK